MTLNSILFALVLVGALTAFTLRAKRLVDFLKVGKQDNRFDSPWKRARNVIAIAFGQTKLLREPLAGILHFLVFWGFVILLAAVLESIGEGLVPGSSFAFLGPLYGPLVFLEDLFGLLVLISVVTYLVRRLALTPKRLRVTGHAKWDAVFIL